MQILALPEPKVLLSFLHIVATVYRAEDVAIPMWIESYSPSLLCIFLCHCHSLLISVAILTFFVISFVTSFVISFVGIYLLSMQVWI